MAIVRGDLQRPFLAVSPYLGAPEDMQPQLDTDVSADVVIVGGGLTGLSTALALKKAGLDPVIVEREYCGFGASGRNAGHLTPTIGKDLPTLLMLFGEKRSASLVRFADHCVNGTEQLIAEQGIDCDYDPSGNIMAAVHPKQEGRLRRAAGVATKLGADVRFIEQGEMRERGLPPTFLSGALETVGGTLHPGKLVNGLRRAALEAGVRIFERTAAFKVKDGARVLIQTEKGTVRADHAVMAGNAYSGDIGKPGSKIYALYVTLFESEALSDAQIESIGGWPGREGIYTAHESLESYRLTRQGTILGGSKGVRYMFGGKANHGDGPNERTQSMVATAFRDRFPQLGALRIAHFWGGWIAMTMNFLPAVGRSKGSNVFHAVGYNGHGVAQATAIGPILRDLILRQQNPWTATIARFTPPLPPEPLGWVFAKGMLRVVDGYDKHIDRQVRSI